VSEEHSLDLFEGMDVGETESQPSMAPEPRVWSVSQVNRAMRSLLEGSVEALWIGGEVGGWTRSRAGHCYFTLKDDRAQLRCVMFGRDSERLPVDPDDGMQIRVFGTLTVYEARGEYQMVVRRLETEGAEGLWRIAFDKLRARLEEEGVLDAARKRPLPRFPSVVGVVTSTEGAALRDIVSVLRRRAPWVRVLVRGTRVQGEGASVEIARAIEELHATGQPDLIIIGRGGGSLEDLWAFNEEPVARAVAACPVPVVSAVGHEVDVTISDLVADLRAPTPSAAAEAVVPDSVVLLEGLRQMPDRLSRGLRGTVQRRRTGMKDVLGRLGRGVERSLRPAQQTVDRGMARLETRLRGLTATRRQRLVAAGGKLDALSPLATLGRGYSVAQDEDGRLLRSVRQFEAGRAFRLRVSDGKVKAETVDLSESES
jgi:exodeoxyribonuclease VII large subunit